MIIDLVCMASHHLLFGEQRKQVPAISYYLVAGGVTANLPPFLGRVGRHKTNRPRMLDIQPLRTIRGANRGALSAPPQ